MVEVLVLTAFIMLGSLLAVTLGRLVYCQAFGEKAGFYHLPTRLYTAFLQRKPCIT